MNDEQYPKVFIVVLNYNGGQDLERCLASLLSLNYPSFEAVVVDNNSDDGSFERAKGLFPRAAFIRNDQNVGFSAGNNVGIKYALERGARYVLLLNNDTLVEKNFLSRLVEAVEKDPKIGLASPLIFGANNETVWFSGGKIDWWRMRAVQCREKLEKDSFSSDFISGCAMLIKTEVFKKVGLLDEDYFLYYEDTDFSLRTKRAGYKLAVVSESRIFHLEKSEQNKKNKTYWLVLSGLIFFQKNSRWWQWPYIYLYVAGRRIKNIIDVKKEKGELALAVGKAYLDFKKTGRN
ncbi:MAG: glycosyltransferase family 2 protein [Candidatus Pacebacteria bacterium]|nr:glycosyltransferase family 2 protein [Candidatus Paceibacterota bacterium]MDR3583250.1 glycosyltransferase family 2 protein [Candidatus Paceibacterota bacterium]